MHGEAASLGVVKEERRRLFRAVRIALVLSATIPVVAGSIYAASSYRKAFEEARERLEQTVVLAEEYSSRVFEGAEAALSEVSQLPTEPPSAVERSSERITAVVNARPYMLTLGVTDAQGNITLSAPLHKTMSVAWRDYFKAQRDGTTKGSLYIGAPVIGTSHKAHSVPISRAVRDETGVFDGVAFLAFDGDYLARFFERISGPSIEAVGLLTATGVLLAQHSGEAIGTETQRHLAARIGATKIEAQGKGFLDVTDSEGRSHVVAFKRTADYGLYAFASVRHGTVLAAWWRNVREVLLVMLLPLAGLALAAYFAERQMHSFRDLVAALAHNRARFRAIFNNSPDCHFLIGAAGPAGALAFLEVSRNSETIFGLPPERLTGRTVHETLGQEEAAFLSRCFSGCLMSGEVLQREHRLTSSETSTGYWEIRIAPLSGEPFTAVGSIRNVAKQKRLMASLRQLTVRLLQRQDHERRQIARDLHDSAAQNLLAASLELRLAVEALSHREGPWGEHFGRARNFIEMTQKEIRGVSYLLHPPMLDESGLPNALHWLVDGFQRRSNIRLELSIGNALNDVRLPEEVEIALFRVAQEALANVHRHADATTVRLTLDVDERDVIEFRVEDDGRSARSAGANTAIREGVGISGMRERLIAFDGTLTFRVSGEGATLSARLPLVQKAA